MAVTNVVVFAGVDTFITDVTFGVTGDTTSAAIPHGLGATPTEVYCTQMPPTTNTVAMDPQVAVTSSTLTVSKVIVAATATGTFRITVKRPHSTGR